MARSWSELSIDHKIVFLLESLVKEQEKETVPPIACRICDQIFIKNKSLVNHYQSHFHKDGTFNPRSLFGSSVSPEIGKKLFSNSLQYTDSLSMNVCNSTAKENLGPCAWINLSPKPPNHSLGDYLGPTLSQDSAISHGIFASQPNRSSEFHPIFASQSIGPQNFHSPIRPMTPGIFYSQTTKPSNFHFSGNPSTSTSQPIQHSSFYFFKRIGALASQTIPDTSVLAVDTTRYLPETALENDVVSPFTDYTKPYIMQLEQPIEEMMSGYNDGDGNSNPDEMDLTLRL